MDEMSELRAEHTLACLALNVAMRGDSAADFDAALAYKMDVIDRLCRALRKEWGHNDADSV